MTKAINIEALFAPVVGQMAWLVRRGIGSMLTLEFGKPHLQVQEPIVPRQQKRPRSAKVKRLAACRRIYPIGQWSFWIAWSYWKISAMGKTCSYKDENHEKVDDVLSIIDGQKLTSVDFQTGKRRLTLNFDLGGSIQLWPPTKTDDQGPDLWMLTDHDKGYLSACAQDCTVSGEKVKRFKPGSCGANSPQWKLSLI